MRVPTQLTIYIFIPLAAPEVCSVEQIPRARTFKWLQIMSPHSPSRHSSRCTSQPPDRADGQRRVLASTLLKLKTLQIP